MKRRLLGLLAATAFAAAAMTGYATTVPHAEPNSTPPIPMCILKCNSWDSVPGAAS